MNYNFNESYLTESFFDDIEDSLYNSDDISNSIMDRVALDSVYNLDVWMGYVHNILMKHCILEDKEYITIKYDGDNNSLSVNFLKISRYFFIYTEDFVEFILKCIHSLNILNLHIYGNINSTFSFNGHNVDLDGHNINLYCHCPTNYFKSCLIKNINIFSEDGHVIFEMCDLLNSDTISVYSGNFSYLNCKNLKNFSFIKNIGNLCTLSFSSYDKLPACNNFSGLPDGNYMLKIIMASHYNNIFSNLSANLKFSLIGIPESVNICNISIQCYNDNIKSIINRFSFEGLTLNLIPKTNITFGEFDTHSHYIIQVGPYKVNLHRALYKPSVTVLKYVIKSQDYYLQCYTDKDGPEIPYDENAVLNLTLLDKAKKSISKANTQKLNLKDKKELIVNKMKDLTFKYLNKDSKLISKWYNVLIDEMDLEHIELTIVNTYDLMTEIKEYDWKLFFKWIVKRPYTIYPTNVELRSLVIDPVLKEVEAEKNNTTYTPDPIPDLTTPTFKHAAELIKISDNKYAVIGNTYTIKYMLKAAGCKFNKNIEYNGEYIKGWTIDNPTEEDIATINKIIYRQSYAKPIN